MSVLKRAVSAARQRRERNELDRVLASAPDNVRNEILAAARRQGVL